jgi:regulator of cell morphogenesis and NO signaling
MRTAQLNRQQTIAELVLDHSECAEVFQRHRIDFCCRGEATVEAAARAQGIALEALIEELSLAIAKRAGPTPGDPRALSTPELVAHIVSTHHDYLRSALPFVQALAGKVSRVHGERNPKLRALALAVEQLTAQLLPHLDDEERTLFPALVAGAAGGLVRPLLDSMLTDHHAVAKLLEQIRAASHDFTLPDWACNSYRTLFSELQRLETDTFRHVHLENHVLLPRFAARQASREAPFDRRAS